jgi:hypothetical protein
MSRRNWTSGHTRAGDLGNASPLPGSLSSQVPMIDKARTTPRLTLSCFGESYIAQRPGARPDARPPLAATHRVNNPARRNHYDNSKKLYAPPLPAALDRRRDGRLFHRPRRQRAGARLRLFRGGVRPALGGSTTHPRRGPAHRRHIAKLPVAWSKRGEPSTSVQPCRMPRSL